METIYALYVCRNLTLNQVADRGTETEKSAAQSLVQMIKNVGKQADRDTLIRDVIAKTYSM